MVDYVINATTPREALDAIAAHLERQAQQLRVHAGWQTGRGKKDLEAQAAFADRQARFVREVRVEPPVVA